MKRYAFVSRHVPTYSQIEVAKKKGVELVHVGDRDAWLPRNYCRSSVERSASL